jgi:hypothetical protein
MPRDSPIFDASYSNSRSIPQLTHYSSGLDPSLTLHSHFATMPRQDRHPTLCLAPDLRALLDRNLSFVAGSFNGWLLHQTFCLILLTHLPHATRIGGIFHGTEKHSGMLMT